MISARSAKPILLRDKLLAKFKYIDRGKKNSLALIPGWGYDYRIFTTLNLEFNYLIFFNFSPFTFEKELLEALRKYNINKISLFAWSLGGFVGSEFAAKYAHLIDELILVSIRKRYNSEALLEIKRHLHKNKRAYLYKFYTQCFSKRKQMSWFRENLLKRYCRELDLNYLLKTLDYLENSVINPESLNSIKKIKIIHGESDCIAPIQEAIDVKNSLTQARFICIKDAGHIPFLREDFSRYI